MICLGVRGENKAQLDDRKTEFSNSSDLGDEREVGRFSKLSDRDGSRTFYFSEFGDEGSEMKLNG